MKKLIIFSAVILLGATSFIVSARNDVLSDKEVIIVQQQPKQDAQSSKKIVLEIPGQGMNPMTGVPSAYCDDGDGNCKWWKVALMNIAFNLDADMSR